MKSTVASRWQSSPETRRTDFRVSPLLRLHDAKMRAAGFMQHEFPRGCKVANVSPQDMSGARENGGCVGKVVAIMLGRPEKAMRLAVFIMAEARRISAPRIACLSTTISAEVRTDTSQDVARDELRIRETAETLRAYIATQDADIAASKDARDAAAARLEELERSE